MRTVDQERTDVASITTDELEEMMRAADEDFCHLLDLPLAGVFVVLVLECSLRVVSAGTLDSRNCPDCKRRMCPDCMMDYDDFMGLVE